MKILYHHRIASKDGQYVHIEEIIRALRQQGHDVIVVAPQITQNAEFGSDGGWMSALRASLPKWVSELLEFGYGFLAFFKLCRAIRRHHPDAIYERYNLFLPAGIWAKTLFHLPLLLEVNSPLYDERKKFGGISLNWLAKWSEHYAWRHADQVLPVSHVLADYIEASGVKQNRITVIPNGVDPNCFSFSDNPERETRFQHKLVIGFVGFCREWHHLDDVIKCIAEQHNPRLMLLIIGDGPVIEELKQLAITLNITDQFYSTGLVERDAMPGWLNQIDIALQPAVNPWASPLKLLEYLATGKAIIAPNTPNIRELVEDNHTALLFKKETPRDLPACLNLLLNQPQLMQSLRHQAAHTIVSRQLTWQANAQTITHLFQTLNSNIKTQQPHTAMQKPTGSHDESR